MVKLKKTTKELYNEVRKRFRWYCVITDKEYPDDMYKLPSPPLVKTCEDECGMVYIYRLSDWQYLYRRVYHDDSERVDAFIGIELYYDDYIHNEYIFHLPVNASDDIYLISPEND
jgi:hypothetical protein